MTEFTLARVGCGILLPDCIGEDVRRENTVGSDEFCDTETATLGEINIVQADSEGCKTDNYLSKTPRAYIIGGEYQWQCCSSHQSLR